MSSQKYLPLVFLCLATLLPLDAAAQLCSVSSTCITARLDNTTTYSNGSRTFHWSVINDCKRAVSFAAFELRSGETASDPADGATYVGRYSDYLVENPTDGSGRPGYRSIKFEALEEGPRRGQREALNYDLPVDAALPDPMRISVKYGPTTETLNLNTSTCELGADLDATQAVSERYPPLNATITYTTTITNAGPQPATGVVVAAPLPPDIEYASDSPSHGTYDSATGQWSIGRLEVNEEATLSITADVTTEENRTLIAQVDASDQTDPDSTPGNDDPDEDDQDSATIRPVAADLKLTKTVDDPAPNLNSRNTFILSVTNQSDDRADVVKIEDVLPSGYQFRRSDATRGSYDAGTNIWTLSLNGSQTATLELIAKATVLSEVTNVGEVINSDLPDPDSTPDNDVPSEDDQDSATSDAVQIDLATTVTAPDEIPDPDQNVTYTVAVQNQGPDPGTEVTVDLVLPQDASFVEATPSKGTYDAATHRWTVGALDDGASVQLDITTSQSDTGDYTLTAEVLDAFEPDPDSDPNNDAPSEDDQDSATVGVLPVELVAFDAVANGNTVMLTWETASETNNAGFEVQHRRLAPSAPADTAWASLGWVEGVGTTSVPLSYRYGTKELPAGTHRFRLKQVDYDGTFDYSPDVDVRVLPGSSPRVVPPYPNPFRRSATLRVHVQRAQHVRAAVYDLLGRRVTTVLDRHLPADSSVPVSLDGGNLPSGQYVLRVHGETFTTSHPVMRIR